jgi:hypothetical protein
MSCCGKRAGIIPKVVTQKSVAATIVKGVKGLSKAAFKIDRLSPDAIQSRRDICRACEFATRNEKFSETKGLTNLSRCQKCKCFIAAKTVISKEKCPLWKW